MPHARKFSDKKTSSHGWLKLMAVVAAAAIFIASCSNNDDAEPDSTTAAPTSAEAPTTPTTAPPSTAPPPTTSVPTTAPPPAPPEYDIAAGVNHSCTLNDGRVFCWGSNLHGQLGNGESGANAHSSTPVEVQGITDAVALGAGWEHTCAVHATGEVSCWGDDSRGELGNGETANSVPLPVKVEGLDDAIDVTAGHWHTCALRSTGEVSCWGSNHDGQLGNDDIGVNSAVPVSVTGISDAVSVGVHAEHSCAVHATGEVSCWGDNWQGELGNGASGPGAGSAVPVKVLGISDALQVASGYTHTCALREGGRVSCWGDNEFGQIGNGQGFLETIRGDSFFAEPTEVVSLDDAISITSGGAFSCAVRETGEISCWGNNSDGQLGNGEKFFSNPSPVSFSGIDDAIGVATGSSYTCALREGGAVSCSGSNIWGELGNGQSGLFTSEQVKVIGIDDAVDVSSTSRHSCVLHENGEVSCWGSNWKGQAGDLATGDSPPVPIKISGISDATDMSAGTVLSCAVRENGEIPCWGSFIRGNFIETEDGEISPVATSSQLQASLSIGTIKKIDSEGGHVCGLQEDGTITCAGLNMFGQLGNGEFRESFDNSIAGVADIDDAIDISLGSWHTCALHESGEVSCWGRNHYGQLGNGEENVGTHSAVPQRVLGITDAIAIEAGSWTTTCALHENGEVSCWGQSDFGELGTNADPSDDHSAVPVKIAGITDAIAIAAGLYHVCALHETGEISCWGTGNFGQLGTDEAVADGYSAAPVKTSGVSDATVISAGFYHTCALHQNGEVTCWGSNFSGQLGNGRPLGNSDSTMPVAVSGFSAEAEASGSDMASDIAAGESHSCTLSEGRVFCWGSNLHGQLGNGESGATAHSSTPVEVRGITDAVAVGAGWEHSCAVHATGEVSCWGDDSSNELGDGETDSSVPLPVKVVGLDDAIDVTAGHWHICALHATGAVSCWGRNHDGQLGNGQSGHESDSDVPVRVRGISDAVSVSANGEHSCAVHATGEVSCWGDNWQGELGNGESGPGAESSVPVKVSGISDALEVASGYNHTCALREGGKVSCWGDNELGQVGNDRDFIDGVRDGSFITGPDEVVSLDDAIAITAGDAFSCAVRETGEISCWGNNSTGQQGNGETFFSNPFPVSVSGIDDAVGIAAGSSHTCALRRGGEISCFGINVFGELGNGRSDLFTSEQVKVIDIDDATAVSSSARHSCVLHENGEVSCWGRRWKGVSGDAATGDSPPVPIRIDGISDATGVAAGSLISCAVRENDEVPCWGTLMATDFTETDDGKISPVPNAEQSRAALGVGRIAKISAEGEHVCGLHEDGTITCAGLNVFGQLGGGEFSQSDSISVANVLNIDDATDISLGDHHTCALHESGEISCWGRNHYGQLGNGEENVGSHSAVPQRVAGITDAIAVAAGAWTTTCALHENGEVSCWGQSDFGELGTNADPSDDHSAVPVKIAGITDAIAVAAGSYHVCVLHESSEVSCWGAGQIGQLGTDEKVVDGYSAAPVRTAGISDAIAISAGNYHTCVVHTTGEVTCWGSDIFGQLGSGEPLENPISTTPVTVSRLPARSEASSSDTASDIAAGANHSCTLNEGKVLCWGSNLHGQLGNGESGATAHSSTPVEAEGITDAVAVGTGMEHTCAVHATGEVSCWGDDSRGELGNGETTDSVPLPVKVVGLDDAIDVTAGFWHTCALLSTGAVSCWGSNHDGQLGNGDLGVDSAVPVRVRGISDAVSVSADGEHSCAVHATGEVSCWGDNWQGELGNGESGPGAESSVPVKVSGISNALEVASGLEHTCALLEDGKVSCWGNNEFGQIGNDRDFLTEVLNDSFINEPDEVVSLDDAIAITAGGASSCALRETGEISCWGNNNDGQLGNNELFFSNPSPVSVLGIDDAIGVAAGAGHTCALREGGVISCFGANIWGELGDGQDDLFTSDQVQVIGIDDATAVSSTYHHSCVLHENGEVSCWGSDWKGVAGDLATGDSPPVPIKISGVSDAIDMSAGTLISCAVGENAEILCWGTGGEHIETEDGEISPVATSSPLQASLGIESIKKIDAEGAHLCLLETNGKVTCAGANNVFGQLGSGEFARDMIFEFANVPGIDDATDISLGYDHTCALHETGEISCWGRNHYGQLGNGEEKVGRHSAVPQRVLGITDAIAVETGALTTTCALHENGEVSCWGQSDLGELGTNADPSDDHSAVPVKIAGITDAIAVAAGLYHVCALHENGEVSCWGAGYFGQLGTDEEVADGYSAAPVKTSGISDATAISAGHHHTCALHSTGEVTCWGSNIFGQLGSGEPLANHLSVTPVRVNLN